MYVILLQQKQSQCVDWLPLAEWWYNTSFHSSSKTSPFLALYGYHPSSITSSLNVSPRVQVVEDHLLHQQQVLSGLKENLAMAQNKMNQHHSEIHF